MKTHHLVLMKFKQADKAKPALDALAKLPSLIPGIESYSAGENNSPEGFAQGFTHAFVMVFRDRSARDVYLDHPEHVKVKDTFLPFVENVIVFDYDA